MAGSILELIGDIIASAGKAISAIEDIAELIEAFNSGR